MKIEEKFHGVLPPRRCHRYFFGYDGMRKHEDLGYAAMRMNGSFEYFNEDGYPRVISSKTYGEVLTSTRSKTGCGYSVFLEEPDEQLAEKIVKEYLTDKIVEARKVLERRESVWTNLFGDMDIPGKELK